MSYQDGYDSGIEVHSQEDFLALTLTLDELLALHHLKTKGTKPPAASDSSTHSS